MENLFCVSVRLPIDLFVFLGAPYKRYSVFVSLWLPSSLFFLSCPLLSFEVVIPCCKWRLEDSWSQAAPCYHPPLCLIKWRLKRGISCVGSKISLFRDPGLIQRVFPILLKPSTLSFLSDLSESTYRHLITILSEHFLYSGRPFCSEFWNNHNT